jgi:hypothetical protein
MTKRGQAQARLVAFDLLRFNGDDLRQAAMSTRCSQQEHAQKCEREKCVHGCPPKFHIAACVRLQHGWHVIAG